MNAKEYTKDRLVPDNVLDVYFNYDSDTDYLGKVKLIEKKNDGLPFTLEDASEDNYVTWSYENWLVEVVESKYYKQGHRKLHKIPYHYNTGITHTATAGRETDGYQAPLLDDNFIMDAY